MASDWQKILDNFSGSNNTPRAFGASSPSTSGSSTSTKKKEDDWQGILDTFSGSNTSKKSSTTSSSSKLSVSDRVYAKTTKKKKKEEEEKEKKWWEKGLFADGYDFGDVSKTILGVKEDSASLKDLTIGSLKKGYYNSIYGEESFKAMNNERNSKDVYEELLAGDEYQFTPGNKAASAVSGAMELLGQQYRQFTNPRTLAFTGSAAGAAAIAGQVGPQVLIPEEIITVPAAAGAAFTAASAASNLEIEAGHAYNEMLEAGISEETARKVALGVGIVNAGLEALQVDELIDAYKVTKNSGATKTFTKKIFDELKDRGVDVAKETAQEVVQEGVTISGVQAAGNLDKGELVYTGEEIASRLEETATSSALSFGLMNVPAAAKNTASIVSDQKKANTLTESELAVVNKEVENRIAEKEADGTKLTKKQKSDIEAQVIRDMEKGYISTDTIEEVLGGESYTAYNELVKEAEEYNTLYKTESGKLSEEQRDRLAELKEKNKAKPYDAEIQTARNSLSEGVFGLVQNERLSESYNERSRRGQAYEADLSRYSAKQQEVIKRAAESGILNNTNRTHEFVDMVAKISADKGVLFDFTNNEKLKNSGFAVEGKTVNGFVTKDGVTLNVNSSKALEKVTGHEITHVLEGTELYTELQNVIRQYAESKGEYWDRRNALAKLYSDVKDADIDAELTADLVGDYLFSDTDFVNRLSTEHRNVFQKIYDEIKYLCKVATAGSKEASELERVKRAFEKAYKAGGKAQSDTKYSISDSTGKELTKEQQDYFKDSKARDENGNLILVHHASPTAGFTVLDGSEGQGNYKYGEYGDGITFFTDNKAMAESYSPSNEKVDTTKLNSIAEAKSWLESIGADYLEVRENNGVYELYDSDEAEAVREYDYEEDLLRDIKRAVQEEYGDLYAGGRYDGYVNIKNPMVVDAEGRPWDRVAEEFSQEVYDKFMSLTSEEKAALEDLAGWEDASMFVREIRTAANTETQDEFTQALASAFNKLQDKDGYVNLFNLYDMASGGFTDEAIRESATVTLSTNDYVERALQAGTYDGVIIKNVIDYGGHAHSTFSSPPGNDYIVFNSNQFKAADNTKPTDDADIRFSLSEEVEKTDRLVAVHNKSVNGVMRMLERDGVPFPSIAIKKAGTSHEGFGDCSIVFPRSTIDPEESKWNKLYSTDAWTPTEPRPEYDVGDTYKYQKLFENMLGSDIYNALKGSSYLSSDQLERELNSNNGRIFDAVKRMGVVKYGYLQSIGQRPEIGTKPKTLDGFGKYKNDQLLAVFDAVDGETLLNATYDDTAVKQQIADALNEQFMQKLPNDDSVLESFKRKPLYSADKINVRIIQDAYQKWDSAGRTIPTEMDKYALEDALRNNRALEEDADYQRWVEDVFDGLVKDSGIPNGKDYYTPSGNPRSFKQLHVPATLDNIVNLMRKENETGVGTLGGINLRGAATKSYATVEDMRQETGRLLGTRIEDDVYDGYMSGFYNRLSGLIDRAVKGDGWNARDTAEQVLLESVRDAKTKATMYTKLRKEAQWIHYNKSLADDLWQLKQDVQNMPTPYFEGKPRRVVTPDEAAAFIIPDNAPAKLFSELDKRGLPYKTYKAGDEADRLAQLNSVLDEQPDLRFSLSNNGEQPSGKYLGRDIALAPVKSTDTSTETDTSTDTSTVAPDTSTQELFPDDLAPLPEDDAEQRLASLEDADAPPEVEAVYDERADLIPLTKKVVADIAKSVRSELGLNNRQVSEVRGIVQKYADTEFPSRDELYSEIEESFGTIPYEETVEDIKEVKDFLRSYKISVSPEIKSDIADYAQLMRSNFGKVRFSKDGVSVDTAYQELSSIYPGSFPEDIINPADQLIQILDVANESHTAERLYEVDSETLEKVTDFIINGVNEYKQSQKLKDAERVDKAAFKALTDDYAPVAEENTATQDIAPVKPVERKSVKEEVAATKEAPKDSKIAEIVRNANILPREGRNKGMMFANKFVDKGQAVENLSLETGNHELQSKYEAARASKAKAAADWMMKHGSKKDGVKSLDAIFKQVAENEDAFNDYLYHLHNIDRMTLDERFGIKNKAVYGDSVTADVSRAKVKELEAAHPEFAKFAEDVYKYNRHLRQMLVDGGLISQETADLWEKEYPHYVPIHRVDESGLGVNVPLDSRKTGVNNPVKRATGGNSKFQASKATMAERTVQTYRAIARNSFGIELKNTLKSELMNEVSENGIMPVGTIVRAQDRANYGTIKAYDEKTGKYTVFFKSESGHTANVQLDAKILMPVKMASVEEISDSIDAQDDLLKKGVNGMNPTFTVFENGERVEFEITEDLFDALKPDDPFWGQTIKPLNAVSNVLRNMLTSWNPVFALYRNPIKDMQEVFLNSQHARATYANVFPAIKELAHRDGNYGEYATEFFENGGRQLDYFNQDTKEFDEHKNIVKTLSGLGAIERAGEFIETVPRLAEYMASRKQGRSIEQSMLDAARVTTNFGAGGEVTKFFNRHGVYFFNAGVQGAAQHVRNFREAKEQGLKETVKLVSKYALTGVVPLIFNELMWGDDEEYAELNDYVKVRYYILHKTQDGKFIRLPKGRTAAVVEECFEQMRNKVTGNDEADFSEFFKLFMDNIAPANPLDNNIIAPIGQALRNETWYGDELVPSRLSKLPAEEQFDESTDAISRWLGERIPVSPVKINYLLDQYSGGLGDIFLPMITPEAKSGAETFGEHMIAPWKKELTTDSVLNNRYPGEFYDLQEKLAVNANARDATEEDKLKSLYLDEVGWEMSDLYAEKREIQNSDLSASEKYDAIRDVQAEINELAENALNGYNNVLHEDYYAEVGDKRFDFNAENGKWYEVTPKNEDGTDNWYYIQEQLSHDKLGISYSDFWNGKKAPDDLTGKSFYGELNGKRYNYDAEKAQWYEIREKNEDGTDNWYYQKEQEVTKGLGISYEKYWSKPKEYNFAYDKPGEYAIAQAIGGYDSLMEHYEYLEYGYNHDKYLGADKDAKGESISGSRKQKVMDYIDGLDLDYGEKIILYRSQYSSKADKRAYNMEIVDYLNSRKDIDYAQMKAILEQFDMTVDDRGYITW